MKRLRAVTALASALLVATAATGCAGDGAEGVADGTETGNAADSLDTNVVPAATSSAAPAVDVKDGTYGKMLVDEKGRTLYLFEKDTKNKSKCDGDCAKAWPPSPSRRHPPRARA